MVIDYGIKCMGIVVMDFLQIIVNGLDIIDIVGLFVYLEKYLVEEEVEMVVVGELLYVDGSFIYLELYIVGFICKL